MKTRPISDFSKDKQMLDEAEEIEESKVMLDLLFELQQGKQVGDAEGWLSHEEMRKSFGV